MADPPEPIADLLADIEGQLDAGHAAALAAEVEDRTRREAALIRLSDRLRGSLGQSLSVDVGGSAVAGVLVAVGAEWIRIAESRHRWVLLPLHGVSCITGMAGNAVAAGVGLDARLDLRHELRGLARDRLPVRLHVREQHYVGTVERVGADFIEVSEVSDAVERAGRSGAVERGLLRRLVPLASITAVRWQVL